MDTPSVGQIGASGGVETSEPVEGNSRVTQSTGSNIGIAETGAGQPSVSLNTPLPDTRAVPQAGSAKTPAERMSDAIASCRDIVAGCDDSKDAAKVVYENLGDILEAIKSKIGDVFSAEIIGKALDEALGETPLPLAGTAKGTVGKFARDVDDGTEEGKASTRGDTTASIAVCKQLKIPEALPDTPNPANLYVGSTFEEATITTLPDGSANVSVNDGFKIHCDAGLEPTKYLKQFQSDAKTFSGDIHVHRLDPGTVLVRVFGQGQSPLRPCWAKLSDDSSSVTCPKDLLTKLAVLPDWNGDGNIAVMIVPKDPAVVVAEGKVATQTADYRETNNTAPELPISVKSFAFLGGGNQCNVLTEDLPEGVGGYPPFANDSGGKLDNCMFCLRDTDMACVRNVIPS